MIDQKMILKLKEAGVSADIILNLLLDEPEAPEPAAAPDPTPEPDKKPAAAPAPKTPDPDPILKAISDLTGAIQASNILRTGRDRQDPVTADDVLAEVLTGRKE